MSSHGVLPQPASVTAWQPDSNPLWQRFGFPSDRRRCLRFRSWSKSRFTQATNMTAIVRATMLIRSPAEYAPEHTAPVVKVEGGCLCGKVRYGVVGSPKSSSVCHCKSCRRACGSQSVAWFVINRSQFALLAGETAKFQSSAAVTRGFCGECGTTLTYEHTDDLTVIEITTATLDRPELFKPTKEIWLSEKVSWATVNPALQHLL